VGKDFWQPLLDFLNQRLIRERTVDPSDVSRILITDSPEEAVGAIRAIAMQRFKLTYGPRLKRRWWWD
jgi:predicted Rossmann-fold nucleotide-binding protein